jgi:hypothetical protein
VTAAPAWLHLSPDTTPASVVVQAVDKATGGHEDDATIARYVVEALTAAGMLASGPPVVEHALGYKSGDMQVRASGPDVEEAYPLDRWISNNQRLGGKVHRRTVIVVEDWVEVPR